LLAERVEDTAMHEMCLKLGFSYFQGYHYARPQIIVGQEIAPEQISILRLMSLARQLETSEAVLEEAFRSDVALTFKLLRIVSTVAVGGRSVRSIRDALVLVGRNALTRWLGLILFSELGRRGAANLELTEMALSRARLCEGLASHVYPSSAAGGLFITGLFSLIDRQMGKPMEEILAEVDLAPEVVRALLAREGPYSVPLRMLESHERGDWDTAVAEAADLGLTPDVLTNQYVDSLEWAREQLSLARS
jgi:EAL and modified HD-GYP domain-containing signal transduction protein